MTAIDAAARQLRLAAVIPDSGEVIGDFSLWSGDADQAQGEIGFVVHPDHHGRGLASEAAGMLLKIGFEDAGLHRIVGQCDARNLASASLMRRLGMRQEAHFRENELIKGEWTDGLVFAMLADEWAARQPAPMQNDASPDPVSDPKGYQDLLVSLVGTDDPVEAQAATLGLIRQLAAEAGADFARRPREGEWSALECVAHILDAEFVVSGRYRWILAHDQPELMGYDQDRWADRLHRPVENLEELLAVFDPLRRANLALWARTPAADRERFGVHRERGPESYGLTFTLAAGHDRFHLAQARRALETLRGA
jgi:hypothetical protein